MATSAQLFAIRYSPKTPRIHIRPADHHTDPFARMRLVAAREKRRQRRCTAGLCDEPEIVPQPDLGRPEVAILDQHGAGAGLGQDVIGEIAEPRRAERIGGNAVRLHHHRSARIERRGQRIPA